MDEDATRKTVRRRYADAARGMDEERGEEIDPCCVPPLGPSGPRRDTGEAQDSRRAGGTNARPAEDRAGDPGCCAPAADRDDDPVTADLYDDAELADLPAGLEAGSLGCGNPTALADLREGETVLDLGSGAGLDVLLSARRVGPSGKAYGVDMTDEMLEKARANAREADVGNVEFLRGEIEDLPLPDDSVDVVISNCVINLSTDKRRALEEAFRVLRPGGRFAVSDIVVRGPVPGAIRRSMELWVGCVAGALEEEDYREVLADAGFTRIEIEPTRVYEPGEARSFLAEEGLDPGDAVEALRGAFAAAFVRARKPDRPAEASA